jgi:antitoxin component YwqK of YwqJK toxin-antitoxin module
MIYKAFAIFFILLHFSILGQSDTLSNTRKNGKWIFYGKERPRNFTYVQDSLSKDEDRNGYHMYYRSDSTKSSEGNIENNKKTGLWIYYYEDGTTIKRKLVYEDDRPTGDFERYYRNGILQEVGTFVRNRYKGRLTKYFENGSIKYEATYDDEGREEGLVKYYYPCNPLVDGERGQIEYEYTVKSGIIVGKVIRYYETGEIKETVMYDENGQFVSQE